MSKEKIGKAVKEILRVANDIWVTDEDLETVVELIRSAKKICIANNLEEMESVHNFEKVIIEEYREREADIAEIKLREWLDKGFTEKS